MLATAVRSDVRCCDPSTPSAMIVRPRPCPNPTSALTIPALSSDPNESIKLRSILILSSLKPKMIETRISSAEVVQNYFHACISQGAKSFLSPFKVMNEGTLRNLKRKPAR